MHPRDRESCSGQRQRGGTAAASYLSSRLVTDPPAFEAESASIRTNGKLNIDGVGIALIALASASLEVALGRGQIDDWFRSAFITSLLVIAVAEWIGTVVWELRVKEPVIEFRLMTSRNFAIAIALFFVFGFGSFGSATLIPQILQSLYGYRATDAGLVLSPGALVITAFAPVAAQLIQRQIVSARALLTMSLIIVAAAMWYFSTFTPATDYAHYALARAIKDSATASSSCRSAFSPIHRPEQQSIQSHKPFPKLGRQLRDCLHHDRDGTTAPVSPNNSRISNWRHVPTVSGTCRHADELSGDEGFFRLRRRERGSRVRLPAVTASGELVVLHGLLSGHRLAHSGCGSVLTADPALHTGRAVAGSSLRTRGETSTLAEILILGIPMTKPGKLCDRGAR